jgi:hypothetical protein
MYNKLANTLLFHQFISQFYCSYMFRRTHVIIRELFSSLLNYTNKFTQFLVYDEIAFLFTVYSQ